MRKTGGANRSEIGGHRCRTIKQIRHGSDKNLNIHACMFPRDRNRNNNNNVILVTVRAYINTRKILFPSHDILFYIIERPYTQNGIAEIYYIIYNAIWFFIFIIFFFSGNNMRLLLNLWRVHIMCIYVRAHDAFVDVDNVRAHTRARPDLTWKRFYAYFDWQVRVYEETGRKKKSSTNIL